MKALVLISICILNFNAFAQTDLDLILNTKRTQIEQIVPESSKSTTLLSSDFAEMAIRSGASSLSELTIIKIYYVYTAYKQSPSFNQNALDKKRFSELESIIPGIVSDPYIEWEIIEQTACKDFSEGDNFFHGFVIIHRPIIDAAERQREIDKLNAFLLDPKGVFKEEKLDPLEDQLKSEEAQIQNDTQVQPDRLAQYKDGDFELYKHLQDHLGGLKEVSTNRDDVWVDVEFEVDETGKAHAPKFNGDYKNYIKDAVTNAFEEMPDWSPATKGTDSINSKVHLNIRVSYSRSTVGIYTRAGKKPKFIDSDSGVIAESDEDVSRIHRKANSLKVGAVYKGMNILDSSERYSIVMDVTGSMVKNIAALKLWLNHNSDSSQITSYSFFNDGNGIATRKKKIGETGGI